ncbi:MAG: hypothetical protein B1H08_02820 [Candidatus Omnitrophica bacterium 4484_171]|nr:MAG: hypothetical protein B1H08_02820 [Candidatus Omnitrophica bacterium 4484_171]
MNLPKGFLVSAIHSGIKKKKLDLGLIYFDKLYPCAGFFTNNRNVSYSVTLSKKHIRNRIKAILVNSGNANCFSHATGEKDTFHMADELAKYLGVKPENILIASTGIIGRKLPYKKIIGSFPSLINDCGYRAEKFSRSIMTTDTFMKISQRSFRAGKDKIMILGFAKGAGMIAPHLATMLAFILTDAGIGIKTLRSISRRALDESFNSITVDGCMSTNDSVYVASSGLSRQLKDRKSMDKFEESLRSVFLDLAKMIVRDAEGATKFVTLKVERAASPKEAIKAAYGIANSTLFKAALYGENANWGRIISAVGQAGVELKDGGFSIKSSPLSGKEVTIVLDLHRGKSSKTVYMSDLTPQYVKINAGYS